MSVVTERVTGTAERDAAVARMSFAFLLDEMVNGVAGLEPLDALLVVAINQANIASLTRDHGARARYGQLEAPAPDAQRRPVSINGVAASLGLPFETVRRRIRKLAQTGVCVISAEGVLVPSAFLGSPEYLTSVLTGHYRLRTFYLELAAAGLAEDLPPSSYELEDDIPMRAAARLLADFVLRASEGLMRESGNVIGALILTALLAAALGDGAPLTIKAISAQLKLPSETVRRHVVQMADDGLCARTFAGVTLTADDLGRRGMQLLLADNAKDVHRLLTGLAERGVIQSWEAPDASVDRGAA